MLQFLQGHITMGHTLPHLVGNNQARHPSASQITEKYWGTHLCWWSRWRKWGLQCGYMITTFHHT